ncbi:hypothetical protein GNF80_02285 [Clostridium perfringens]|nr:hypothetical protein [Clostridium perfringens]
MKKRMPLILTIIFLCVIVIFSGIFIYINSSSIKFKDIYGSRSELGDNELVIAKDKGLFTEELTVGVSSINKKYVITEQKTGEINVLKDKKFFRGIYPTAETFYEDESVMVDVTNLYNKGIPKLGVRLKDKKTNSYEEFKVEIPEYIHNSSRINGVSYKDGKIDILFFCNNGENNLLFGEIDIKNKKFELLETINVDKELDLNKEYSHINEIMQRWGSASSNCNGKVYYKLTEINNKDERGTYTEDSIVEVDIDNKKITRYSLDENIREELKNNSFEIDGKSGTMFEANGDIYIIEESEGVTSVLTFNMELKKFTFYKDLIESKRLERYGINVNDLGNFMIVGDKVIANLIDYEHGRFYNKNYVAVIDIPSKNPVYVGELGSGYLSQIKVTGGK